MSKLRQLITVGFGRREQVLDLAVALQRCGHEPVEAAAVRDLPVLLEQTRDAPILAYKGPDVDVAQVLEIAGRASRRRRPVIVLVDRSEFEEYYDLMCQGACNYFEVSDGPEVIERALTFAARQAAGDAEEELSCQRLATLLVRKICAVCPDRNVDGSCDRRDEGSCTLLAKLPEAAAAILAVESDRMEPYIQSIRERVCAPCELRNPDGSCGQRDTDNCMLNSYLPLVVETVEEFFERRVSRE